MPDSVKYRPDIDGLRAVAVLAIVVHHFAPGLLPGGYVGVDVFFVISGFLITGIISRSLQAGDFSFAGFYLRRARRLLPALYAMLATVLLAGWLLLLPSDYDGTLRAALGSTLFASNVVFERILSEGYFAADAKLNPLLHTWSLGVEEQFYLLYPALLAVAWRLGRSRGVAWLLVLGIALSFAASAMVTPHHPTSAFFLAPFRAWELLLGAAIARFRIGAEAGTARSAWLRAAGLLAILASTIMFDTDTVFPGVSALLPVLGTAMVIAAGKPDGGALVARPMVYLGLISYSLYLWHWPLLVFAKLRYPEGLPVSATVALGVLAVAGAAASYRWIETPMRDPRPMRWRAPMALATSLAILALCGAGVAQGGFKGRFDAGTVALDDARKQPFAFRDCRPATNCRIGTASVAPDTLLWGDSHMLAWAPGFDALLKDRQRSALLAYTPACPPLLEVEVSRTPDCRAANREALALLSRAAGVRTVVLASRWGLNGAHPEWFRDIDGHATTVEASLLGLVVALKARGLRVVVLGPVPVYGTDVPMRLARERAYGWPPAGMSLGLHRQEHRGFYAAVPAIERAGARVVDPAAVMCTPTCARGFGGFSLYRDKQHLSARGARELARRALAPAL